MLGILIKYSQVQKSDLKAIDKDWDICIWKNVDALPDDAPNAEYALFTPVAIMAVLFCLQLTLLPIIQVPNIKYSLWFYNYVKSGYKDMAPMTYMANTGHHGANLTVTGFVTLWTFIANVAYVF